MKSDTSERGLERPICTALTGAPCDSGAGCARPVRERPDRMKAGPASSSQARVLRLLPAAIRTIRRLASLASATKLAKLCIIAPWTQ